MRAWLLAFAGALATCLALAATPEFPGDAAFEARVQRLAAELRCLVCQNQSLADSHADLALQLKEELRQQLRAGRSDTEVMAWMTARYGDFVLYRPPLKATTALLWAGPALLVLLGLGALAWQLRRRSAAPPPAELSEQDKARAAKLLET